jgi:signal transduction histidine kinase
VLVLFGTELVLVPKNSVALFALYPMIFMAVRLRVAVPYVVLASLAQPGVLIARGDLDQLRHHFLIPLVGMVIAVILGTYIDRMVNESERRASLIERLEASQAEVARLSHEAGTAAERARLAREIHDTLAQGFTSIVALVQADESELDSGGAKARRHLASAVRTARENLDQARAMVAVLTPSALDAGSLDDAIRRQVDRLGEETGIHASYRTVGMVADLPTAVEVVLLRAVQEALSNVRKHSGATSVSVVLRFTDDAVTLSVADDGTGMASESGPGFGLRGMLESEPDLSVVGEAGSGAEALALARARRPDVILMDLRMPETDGVWATERILAESSHTRVVVLTTYETDADILRAVESRRVRISPQGRLPGRARRRDQGGGPRRDRARAVGGRPPGSPGAPAGRPQPVRPRAGGAGPGRQGSDQRGDRHAPAHLRGHREDPPAAGVRQARRLRSDRGRDHRHGHGPSHLIGLRRVSVKAPIIARLSDRMPACCPPPS